MKRRSLLSMIGLAPAAVVSPAEVVADDWEPVFVGPRISNGSEGLLTADVIAKEALRILTDDLSYLDTFYRAALND